MTVVTEAFTGHVIRWLHFSGRKRRRVAVFYIQSMFKQERSTLHQTLIMNIRLIDANNTGAFFSSGPPDVTPPPR